MEKVLVREMLDGHPYEYYPISEHIVAAPGVCGGRLTFRYTRIDVRHILSSLAAGETPERIVRDFEGRVSREAVEEALQLARRWPRQAFEEPYVPEKIAA